MSFLKNLFGKKDPADEMMELMGGMSQKWIKIGYEIADDCYVNGLEKGSPVFLSQVTKQIHEQYNYNANVIENGFLTRLKEYIDKGLVINYSIEGGDAMFVHPDHAESILNDMK